MVNIVQSAEMDDTVHSHQPDKGKQGRGMLATVFRTRESGYQSELARAFCISHTPRLNSQHDTRLAFNAFGTRTPNLVPRSLDSEFFHALLEP